MATVYIRHKVTTILQPTYIKTHFSLNLYQRNLLWAGLWNTPFLVVVYQCSISNVMYTGDIEAPFLFLVHAVLDCQKPTRCFVEPIQLLPLPGLDWQVHTHSISCYSDQENNFIQRPQSAISPYGKTFSKDVKKKAHLQNGFTVINYMCVLKL